MRKYSVYTGGYVNKGVFMCIAGSIKGLLLLLGLVRSVLVMTPNVDFLRLALLQISALVQYLCAFRRVAKREREYNKRVGVQQEYRVLPIN
jgi:hypothetical protein